MKQKTIILKDLNSMIEAYLDFSNFFFIQVGANDGLTNDPINEFIIKYKWKGILIEPQKRIFEELKKNYSSSKGLSFENIAISSKKELRSFYSINLPQTKFASGLSSFNREHLIYQIKRGYVQKQAREEGFEGDNFESLIIEEKIQCDKFKNILERHKVKKIDLLQIDAEGFDFEIIKMFPFLEFYLPKMINYENENLNDFDKKACKEHLRALGYVCIDDQYSDTLAIHVSVFDVLGLEVLQKREHLPWHQKLRKKLGHKKYILKKAILG